MTGTDTTAPAGGAAIGVGDSQARAVAQALALLVVAALGVLALSGIAALTVVLWRAVL